MLKLELEDKEYFIPESPFDESFTMEKFDLVTAIMKERNGEPLTKGDVIEITCALSGIEKDFLLDAPGNFFDLIADKTKWIYTLEKDVYKICDYIDAPDGYRYSYEKSADKPATREWVDIDTILTRFKEEDKNPSILSVRLRRMKYKLKQVENEKGIMIDMEDVHDNRIYFDSIEKYHTDMIEQRKAMFKSMPVAKVYPLLNFFLSKGHLSSTNINLYSLIVSKALDNQLLLNDWVKNSGGGKPLSNLQKKIYGKWMPFLTSQLGKHVHFLHTLQQKDEPKAKH